MDMSINRLSGSQGVQRLHETGESSKSAAVPGVKASNTGAVTQRPSRSPSPRPKFAPSGPLSQAAKALAKELSKDEHLPTNLDQSKQRMILEGRYLEEHADKKIPFHQVSKNLGLQSTVAKEVQEQRQELLVALANAHSKPEAQQMGALTHALREAMHKQTRLMAGRAAMYQEVLERAKLPKDDEKYIALDKTDIKHIERSESAFSRYATELSHEIPLMVQLLEQKASSLAESTDAAATLAKENIKDNDPDATRFASDLAKLAGQWKDNAEQVGALKKDLSQDFSTAVNQAKLTAVLEDYQSANHSLLAPLSAYVGGAVPQWAASVITFGLFKGLPENNIENVPARIAATASTMTLSHELTSNLVRPALADMMGSLGLRPLNSAEVIPDANPRVSSDGVTRVRSKDEREAAQEIVKGDRKLHLNAKQNHKVGTLAGNLEFIASFAVAQAVGAGLDLIGTDSNSILGRMIKSGAGGINAGGMSAASQLASTSTESGRKREIPAYTFKESGKPLNKALQETAANWVKSLDVSDEKVRKTNTSKLGGLVAGLSASAALEVASERMNEDTPAGQFGIVSLAGLGPAALLVNAFASFNVNADVAADQKTDAAQRKAAGEPEKTPGVVDFARVQTGVRNITSPNREQVPHGTEADSAMRYVENAGRVLDGISQVASQAVPDALSTAGNIAAKGYEQGTNFINQKASERAQRNEARQAQPVPAGRTTSSAPAQGEEIELPERRRHHNESDMV